MISLCILLAQLTTQAPESELAPAAQPHNLRGIAHIEAGAHALGVDELEQAYALMPDPLRYRAGRSKVLGSMRSALNHLYRSTGDPAYLHRLQELLLRHLEALVAALGDAATEDDVAGSLDALHEVEDALAQVPVAAPAPVLAVADPLRAPPQPPTDRATALHPSHEAHAARLRRASGALFGVGAATLGVMTYAVVVYVDSRHKLRALTRSVEDSGAAHSGLQQAEATDLLQRSHTHRTLAVVTGTVAGAAIVTGVVLHVLARRRSHTATHATVVPTLAPGFAGLDLRLRF